MDDDSLDDEFKALKARARNLGYILVAETGHPDSPHAAGDGGGPAKSLIEDFVALAREPAGLRKLSRALHESDLSIALSEHDSCPICTARIQAVIGALVERAESGRE